jgi:hypothetical protein
MNIQVSEVSYHRNGCNGTGFHAVLFTADIEMTTEEEAERWNIPANPGERNAKFLGIVFDKPGSCAVICLDHIGKYGVRFGQNSWRGDHYEPELRKAIRTMKSSGSVRVGPFGFPTPNESSHAKKET